jgi:hypothetical protein
VERKLESPIKETGKMDNRKLIVTLSVVVAVVAAAIVIITSGSEDAGPVDDETALTAQEPNVAAEPCQPALSQQEILEQERAEAERKRQLQEQQNIAISITDYPAGAKKGGLFAIYRHGPVRREFNDQESPGQMVLAGPNKLGGELAVYIRQLGLHFRVWAYIKSLDKTQISLPADADMVVTQQDLAEVSLSFAQQDQALLKYWTGVAFYNSAGSQTPLFFAVMRAEPNQVADYNNVPLEIVPGRYHARAVINKDGQESYVQLPMIDVVGPEPKTYPVEIPYK